MNVEFQNQGSLITAALADHARRRLLDVMTPRSDFIQRIVVRLGGTHSRRSHCDMHCLMQAYLSDAFTATVVDIGPDIHDAITRAADRLGSAVVAHLDQATRDRRQIGSGAITRPRPDRRDRLRQARRGRTSAATTLRFGDQKEHA
jgi:hypothetical protein